MKLRPVPGEYKYAVAVREGGDLWVTLWVRRSWKGEFFIMIPRGDPSLDVHTSYHRDGALHMKSHDRKAFKSYRRQPLTGVFRGSVDLGNYHGHGAESVGAICDATAFSGVVEVAPGVLGRAHGAVGVFLVEPGLEPPDYALTHEIVTQSVFRDVTPNVVITVLRDKSLKG
jgi:hypothetical protein